MDIILTGIARSGTTLTCSLLNQLPQCVALHEPLKPASLVGLDFPKGYMDWIAAFFAAQRASLLSNGTALSKGQDGRLTENPYASRAAADGLRSAMHSNQEVVFHKPLHDDFRLVIKQPNCFTATLATLQNRYPCYAIIRNPLSVLLSWHSIQAPVNDGHVPYGEAFDPDLKDRLAAEPDRITRQLIILTWYYSRYATVLPSSHVIRYEELIASRGQVLAVIDPAAEALQEPLQSRNTSSLYDSRLVCQLADRLLADRSIYGPFYTAKDVESLVAAWTGTA